jgi:hypothetical protein
VFRLTFIPWVFNQLWQAEQRFFLNVKRPFTYEARRNRRQLKADAPDGICCGRNLQYARNVHLIAAHDDRCFHHTRSIR